MNFVCCTFNCCNLISVKYLFTLFHISLVNMISLKNFFLLFLLLYLQITFSFSSDDRIWPKRRSFMDRLRCRDPNERHEKQEARSSYTGRTGELVRPSSVLPIEYRDEPKTYVDSGATKVSKIDNLVKHFQKEDQEFYRPLQNCDQALCTFACQVYATTKFTNIGMITGCIKVFDPTDELLRDMTTVVLSPKPGSRSYCPQDYECFCSFRELSYEPFKPDSC